MQVIRWKDDAEECPEEKVAGIGVYGLVGATLQGV